MKKKILIVYPDLSMGGSTSSLLALLNEIDYSKYQVDIKFLTDLSCEDKEKLNNNVNVLAPAQKFELTSLKVRIFKIFNGILTGEIFAMLFLYFFKYKNKSKIYFKVMLNQILAKINSNFSNSYEEEYDVGVAFLEQWATHYLNKKVRAKKKIAFVHIDYVDSHFAIELDKKAYNNMDSIACVSNECVKSFVSVYPQGKTKTHTIENLIDYKEIIKKSHIETKDDFFDYKGFKIVTVGRIEQFTKGIDRIILSQEKIKTNINDFRWYIIGDGNDLQASIKMNEENNTTETVRFLGRKENPYPYIKNADLFVLPSRHEGKPMVVTEAQILNTPILVTEYASAHSQIRNNIDGVVIENNDVSLADGIIQIYHDKEKIKEIKENLKALNFSNDEKLKQFYDILS